MNYFNNRKQGDFWTTGELTQTCVKSKIGCGEPIYITFFAPLNEENPEQEI